MPNNLNNIERASTIIEALPYIQKFRGKVVVIKYGGNAMISPELSDAVMEDIIMLYLMGIKVVLVHGGGPEINDMLKKIGKKSVFKNGLRYTDEETMYVVQSVLCGKVNKDLVSTIVRKGAKAMGLCGMDNALLSAKALDRGDGEDYGLVGELVEVNTDVLIDAMENNYIPVVASVAHGIDGNNAYNINADTAAAKIASALKAEKLILLTDTQGVLKDPSDPSSLIKRIYVYQIKRYIDEGVVTGGMIPKLTCCAEAINGGVTRTHILDGRVPHSIIVEMLTDEGAGTMIL
ncbi:MAG: acetylglutamate kinase [Oscillospiraceae bacterium]|nr:acetylglutamate kinase [Oscillospiraceae bacterium]